MKSDEKQLWESFGKDAEYATPRDAGIALNINHKRVIYLCEKWVAKGTYEYGVTCDMGWKVTTDFKETKQKIDDLMLKSMRPYAPATYQITDETHVFTADKFKATMTQAFLRYSNGSSWYDPGNTIVLSPIQWKDIVFRMSDIQLLDINAHRKYMVPFEYVQLERERRAEYRNHLIIAGLDEEAINIMIALGGYPNPFKEDNENNL